MKRPRYSIVVPTRQRHETLLGCLRTLVDQPSDDYEIVVADNASSEETRAVCDSFRSPKLRHVRCDEPLSMMFPQDSEFRLSSAEKPGLVRRLRRAFTKRVRRLAKQGTHEEQP